MLHCHTVDAVLCCTAFAMLYGGCNFFALSLWCYTVMAVLRNVDSSRMGTEQAMLILAQRYAEVCESR